jgi:hypothetical protein
MRDQSIFNANQAQIHGKLQQKTANRADFDSTCSHIDGSAQNLQPSIVFSNFAY